MLYDESMTKYGKTLHGNAQAQEKELPGFQWSRTTEELVDKISFNQVLASHSPWEHLFVLATPHLRLPDQHPFRSPTGVSSAAP